MAETRYETLKNAVNALPGNLEGRVRREAFLAAAAPESSGFLTASPWQAGTKMANYVFQFAVRTRLGISVDGVPVGATCKECSKPMDTLGQHAYVCPNLRDYRNVRAAHHQAALRAITRGARDGIITLPGEPVVETYMDPVEGREVESKKRADVAIIPKNGQNGGDLVLIDLTLVATSAASRDESTAPGEAATGAEVRKDRRYALDYKPRPNGPRASVRGFGQETGGPLGEFAKKFLHYCAELTPPQGLPGHDPVARRYRRLTERLSVFLQTHCALVQLQYIQKCCKQGDPHDLQGAGPDDVAAPANEGGAPEG
jgi:hypothetical protein